MRTYRCYFLDDSDRIKSFVELHAPSDEKAIAQARRRGRASGRPVEVWRGNEMIYSENDVTT
jgi:hypothetical protein